MEDKIKRVRPEGFKQNPHGAPLDPPNKVVDEKTLKRYAEKGCSYAELADIFGVTEATFRNNPKWKAIITAARADLNMTLRQAQIDKALSGDTTLLVWLGKVYLKQSDKIVVQNVSFNDMSEEDLQNAIEMGRKYANGDED